MEPVFGPNDIATLFFVNKSDDRNRVDYGMRLDADCVPVGDDPVFPYWREFENSPPVRTHGISWIEHLAYGVAEQHLVRRTPTGAEHFVRLKPLPRDLLITTEKGADGTCQATVRTIVAGVPGAELLSAYIKLRGVMSLDYLELHGRDAKGQPLLERLEK